MQMECVMLPVLCQNACFSEVTLARVHTHTYTHTRSHTEDAWERVVQNFRPPYGRAAPCTWGVTSLWRGLALLPSLACCCHRRPLPLSTPCSRKHWTPMWAEYSPVAVAAGGRTRGAQIGSAGLTVWGSTTTPWSDAAGRSVTRIVWGPTGGSCASW